jgi:hypothetical protein
MAPLTKRRPGIVVRAASQAIGPPTATPKTAAAALTHKEFVRAVNVPPVNACRMSAVVNHCEPWSNIRGETANTKKQAQGANMKAANASQKTGRPSLPKEEPRREARSRSTTGQR